MGNKRCSGYTATWGIAYSRFPKLHVINKQNRYDGDSTQQDRPEINSKAVTSNPIKWNGQSQKYLEAATLRRLFERLFFQLILFGLSGDSTDVCKSIDGGSFKGERVLQPRYEDVWIQALSVQLRMFGLYPCERVWIQVFFRPC